MSDFKSDKVNDLLESVINSSSEAWVAQSEYFDDLVKRNVATFSALSDARIESLQAIGESQNFNQAFEANIAYEHSVREALTKIHDENTEAWENLQAKLSDIYVEIASDKETTSE